jgi:hypothetical protein
MYEKRIIYKELLTDVFKKLECLHTDFFKLSGYNHRKRTFEECKLTNTTLRNFKKYKVYDDLLMLINNTKKLLRSNKIRNFNENKFYVEFQRANLPELNNINTRKFDLHFDDYGAVSYPVWTVIYYIRKDNGIKGGNFEYRPNFYKFEIKKIKLNECSILIFPGNIYHSAEKMSGFGCRDLILIQFARTK